MQDGDVGAVLAVEIARQHRIAADDVRLLAQQGVANETYGLSDRLILRIARVGYEVDLATEAAVLPVVIAAGVPAPTLQDYDSGGLFGRPYLLQGRCQGTRLAEATSAGCDPGRPYRELGAALRQLHTAVPLDASMTTSPALRLVQQADPGPMLDELLSGGWISPDDAAWLVGCFDHLRQWLPAAPRAVLLHGDASPTNVLIDPSSGAVTALLDWGDAHRSDPAVDLAKIPGPHLPAAIAGYSGSGDSDEQLRWAARALWHHLAWALGRLSTPPRLRDPSWSAPPAARLLGITRLLLGAPEAWTALVPPRR